MATSNTTAFNPSLGELVLYAYQRAGLRSTELTVDHFVSARMASNLMLAEWSNDGPALWKVDLVTVPLVAGQATYPVDPGTLMILDAYVSQGFGLSPPTDRIMLAISRSEYAAYPVKNQPGVPSVYWFNRLISPTITVWQVPQLLPGSPQSMSYYCVNQMQDAELPGGQTLDMVYRFLNAFAEGLALKLAGIWNPERVQLIQPMALMAYKMARREDTERAKFFIAPQLSGYWRI